MAKLSELKEEDLYYYLETYFESQGYKVQGEVCGCDLVALRDDDLIIVELKKAFNVKLLYQGVRRLAATKKVYIAFFKPQARQKMSFWTMVKSLARRLQLGVIVVEPGTQVKDKNSDNSLIKVLVEPSPFLARPAALLRKKILKEFNGRKISKNAGGVQGQKINTAYLESAVQIATLLYKASQMTAVELKSLGAPENAYNILYNNHYGWFEKKEKGYYGLKKNASREIQKKHPEIWNYYRGVVKP